MKCLAAVFTATVCMSAFADTVCHDPLVGDIRIECAKPKGWTFSLASKGAEDGVRLVSISLTSPTEARPPEFVVRFGYPGVGADHVWTPYDDRYMLYPTAWGGDKKYSSQLAYHSPLLTVFDDAGSNTLALACSEAFRKLQFGAGIGESDCNLRCSFRFFTEFEPASKHYEATIRIDSRRNFWADAVRSASDWISDVNGFVPCRVPDAAYDPLYSTWYAFWQDVHAPVLEKEMPLAYDLGMRTAILDDGWQKVASKTFYSATGDWQPVPSRFPDMKGHVAAVHRSGMKYMLWFSVPFVGDESKSWSRFQGKFLRTDGSSHPGAIGVLDPRFPEVREYLIAIYERAVRDWGFDGLKLDFIDEFVIRGQDPAEKEAYKGRDIRSLPVAVDTLMKEIVRRVQQIRPDVLIEFRQHYMGPAIRQYGNMIRALDCPADSDKIRKLVADLRLTSGTTAVHSDMLVWNPKETPERAARPILNSLFGVVQYSMILDRLPSKHRDVIRHWLRFTQQHRATLLKGAFRPYHPELLYPQIEAESAAEKIVAVYSSTQLVALGEVAKPVYIINGTAESKLAVESSTPLKVTCHDVFGNAIDEKVVPVGITRLDVPVSGYAVMVGK